MGLYPLPIRVPKKWIGVPCPPRNRMGSLPHFQNVPGRTHQRVLTPVITHECHISSRSTRHNTGKKLCFLLPGARQARIGLRRAEVPFTEWFASTHSHESARNRQLFIGEPFCRVTEVISRHREMSQGIYCIKHHALLPTLL